MTNLEALKSLTEYSPASDDLFTKSLLDRAIDGTDTYAATNAQGIDLTLADIYLYLSGHPDMTEGRWSVMYPSEILLRMRRDLYAKWSLALPELTQANALKVNGRTASDTALW